MPPRGAPRSPGGSGEEIIAGAEADESNFAVAVMAIASDELRFENAVASGLKREYGSGRTSDCSPSRA